MSVRSVQQRGRQELCDSLIEAGPAAPTLCEGWAAIDLAAHLVVREQDSWTAPVILCGRLNGIVERLTARQRARGFDRVVQELRNGPPWLFRSTPLTQRLNTVEDWIHHQDVRRANDLAPLPTTPELDDVLWRGLDAAGKVAALRLPDVGLVAAAPDGRRTVVKKGSPVVEIVGLPGELLLFVTGRGEVADVQLRGPADAVALVESAPLRL